MRQITKEAIEAFYEKRSFKKSNTEVSVFLGKVQLYLFGNLIARMAPNGQVSITDAGWQTPTTKERLNGLKGVSIHQSNKKWFLNGKPWDGAWQSIHTNKIPSQLKFEFNEAV